MLLFCTALPTVLMPRIYLTATDEAPGLRKTCNKLKAYVFFMGNKVNQILPSIVFY